MLAAIRPTRLATETDSSRLVWRTDHEQSETHAVRTVRIACGRDGNPRAGIGTATAEAQVWAEPFTRLRVPKFFNLFSQKLCKASAQALFPDMVALESDGSSTCALDRCRRGALACGRRRHNGIDKDHGDLLRGFRALSQRKPQKPQAYGIFPCATSTAPQSSYPAWR